MAKQKKRKWFIASRIIGLLLFLIPLLFIYLFFSLALIGPCIDCRGTPMIFYLIFLFVSIIVIFIAFISIKYVIKEIKNEK